MTTPEKTDQEKLNPRRRVLEVGTRQLREITLWPLAFRSQLELKDIIIASAQEFFITVLPEKLAEAKQAKGLGLEGLLTDPTEVETMEYIKFFVGQIEKNIAAVLALAIDKNEDSEAILQDADNDQVSEMATIIFEANFEGASKNVKGLVSKVKEVFQLTRQQPQSADGTDTNLTISTGRDLKMVD